MSVFVGARVGPSGTFLGENSKRDACKDCHGVFRAVQDTL